jgi:hypothetical protein
MSDHIKTSNSKLFINLSEKQQESVCGRYGMFYIVYQNTHISTSGSNIMKIYQGDFSASSESKTDYQFSQVTFIIASLFGVRGESRRNNRRGGSSLLARILSFL